VELAVDVAADGDGCIDGDDVAFLDEEFACLVAEFTDLWFGNGATGAELRDCSGKTVTN
jgi:hypothetical protein